MPSPTPGQPSTAAEAAAHRPLIIAMKGHPGTGKSTLASYISYTFRIPLLDKDDIKDSTIPLTNFTPLSLLNDLSYSALFNLTSTQLRLNLPAVVVDSPLSHRSHLERLVKMAEEVGGKVVVVECRAGNEEEWKRRLEERGCRDNRSHKPKNWEELRKLVAGYGGRDMFEMADGVERVVVDGTLEEVTAVRERVLGFLSRFL
ncbi:ATP-binding protein (P-loop) [Zostera marina]|uniref:ATP-binding protein (P-loop) n=1 Tax=Zostera marina TaxID=29655 RepID=A0A0K9PLS0_ZOSMR|nr:ATP-binding protein (P-loop) [Zostera marina]